MQPSFSAGFQTGNSHYSVYGTNDQGKNTFHSLNLHSAYDRWRVSTWAPTTLIGASHSLIPLGGGRRTVDRNAVQTTAPTDSMPPTRCRCTARSPPASTAPPGTANTWVTHSSGTIDTFNTLAAVHPLNRLSLSASANYSDNLSGQLIQSVVTAGGVVPGLNSNQASNSLDIMGVASYTPLSNLQTSAFVERRTQSFLGEDYGVSSYGGSATYSHKLPDGSFNAAMTMTANAADKTGEDTLSFSTNENYSG